MATINLILFVWLERKTEGRIKKE